MEWDDVDWIYIAAGYASVTDRFDDGHKSSGARKCTHFLVYLSYY
jgi:hypothetical protein